MNLVKLTTGVLEFVTKKSLAKAKAKNEKNLKRLRAAKNDANKSAKGLEIKQAETLIQLHKVQNLSNEIGAEQTLQAGKASKISALLQDIED